MQTILVADSDPTTAQLLREMVAPEKFEIRSAEDGAGADMEITRNPPSLLILELLLSRPNGFALLRSIADRGASADMKVMVVTSRAFPQDKMLAQQLGADAFLVKPFKPERLLSLVESLFS